MTNKIMGQKAVENLVDKAIASSKDHGKLIKQATIACIRLAASEIGRMEPLNRLFSEVNRSDADGVRFYILNLANTYGPETNASTPKNRKGVSFIQYEKETKSWKFNKSAEGKICRETVVNLADDKLEKLVFGSVVPAGEAASNQFDFGARLLSLVKTAAREGEDLSMLNNIARFLPGDKAVTIGDLEAIRDKAKNDLETARKNLADKEAKFAEAQAKMERRENPDAANEADADAAAAELMAQQDEKTEAA